MLSHYVIREQLVAIRTVPTLFIKIRSLPTQAKPPVSTAGSRDRTFSNVSVLSGGRPRSSQSTKTDPHLSDTISETVEESLSSLELQLQERDKIR